MSSQDLLLALRGSKGLRLCSGHSNTRDFEKFKRDENPTCRDMAYTKDGSIFSWCTSKGIFITSTSNYTISQLDKDRTVSLSFSPKGTYLSTWEPYAAKAKSQESSCNLDIWDTKSGTCLKSFIQKKHATWKPQWSDDEYLCARNVNNEVHFFEDAKFESITKKIFMQKVADFSLAPGSAPYHVACFVPGSKGQPSFVRLFKYPNFEGSSAVIAQKSFFKAEKTDFFWNKTGKDVILLTCVEVDKSGSSYYGELNLYYLSVKGETARVMLGKEGPVYSISWSPNAIEFCVVYGYMPAKATIYNLKSEPVFDFGTGPRCEVHYAPFGDKLTLCGFGNLHGQIEIWDLKEKKQVVKFTATDSTCLQWSPDGEYILTATTSPRLRIGNGYRVWHYTGSLLQEIFLDINEELWDIKWQPFPEGTFKEKAIQYKPVEGIKSAKPEASKQVYRPPAAQGKQSRFKLHDDEPANDGSNKELTKNQKKNMARKAKKESEKCESNEESVATNTNDIADKLTGDPEKDKKIKSILKKLDQINKLKQDQKSGKALEINQLEKIKKEIELHEELENLQL